MFYVFTAVEKFIIYAAALAIVGTISYQSYLAFKCWKEERSQKKQEFNKLIDAFAATICCLPIGKAKVTIFWIERRYIFAPLKVHSFQKHLAPRKEDVHKAARFYLKARRNGQEFTCDFASQAAFVAYVHEHIRPVYSRWSL